MTAAHAIAAVLAKRGYVSQRQQAAVLGIVPQQWSLYLHRSTPKVPKVSTVQAWLRHAEGLGVVLWLEVEAEECRALGGDE